MDVEEPLQRHFPSICILLQPDDRAKPLLLRIVPTSIGWREIVETAMDLYEGTVSHCAFAQCYKLVRDQGILPQHGRKTRSEST